MRTWPLHLHGNMWWAYGPHPSAQRLILAQQRITKEVIVAECSQAESQLHLTSCAYEPSHKSELMLHLSKGDHCLTPHPLLVLATRTGRLFAVISACSRWEGNWSVSHLAWPSVQRPRRPRARGPSPEHVQRLAALPSVLVPRP